MADYVPKVFPRLYAAGAVQAPHPANDPLTAMAPDSVDTPHRLRPFHPL